MKKLKYKSNIVIVTSSRAEYGLLANLINLFENKNKFNFELVVIGQHLSKKYGMTINHFFKKKISIKKIKTHPLFTQVDGGIEEWEVINDEPQ